jgi:anti-anti-sigma factor
MFTLSIQNEGTVISVIPEGRLDTLSSSIFSEKLQPLLDQENYLIIDFSNCNYLASSGIRSLMLAAKKLNARGGALMLSNLPPEVFQVIEMTGLQKVFPVFKNQADAREEILRLKNRAGESTEILIGEFNFHVQDFTDINQNPCRWDHPDIAGYNELGISVGTGSPAESLIDDGENRGTFITLGKCAGFIPFDKNSPPEFRVLRDASAGGIFVQEALSFGPDPAQLIKLINSSGIELRELLDAVLQIPYKSAKGKPAALLIADSGPSTPSILLVSLLNPVIIPANPVVSTRNPELLPAGVTTADIGALHGARFLLNELSPLQPGEPLSEFLNRSLTIENIESVESLQSTVYSLQSPVCWLFYADEWRNADDQRIKVETTDGFILDPYKAFLARRLYTDSGRVVIKQLHGGYSAQTFQVDSYDHEGRKLRPTVLKISNRDLISREAERCQQYALPYIMNNSAIVLGTAFYCDQGALRYNFVGIGGEQTRLKWLTHLYNEWPVEQLEPLFDKIFLQILKPWYGQPVKMDIHPYIDHDPTLTFFPMLCEAAKTELSIDADDRLMTIPETGEMRTNPYWFLRHEFHKRRQQSISYFTSICHGDLNMQNILLDKEMNVYLIDFSETKPRSAISDFARLEAIFMVEHALLDTEEDRKTMIEFTSRFYGNHNLNHLPDITWTGGLPDTMNRNLALTLKMRSYAIECTSGESTIVPYYLALLEWILPIVCYSSAPMEVKRLSAYVSGMLCQVILAAD